jgi:M6 family metalloprotease-like protein
MTKLYLILVLLPFSTLLFGQTDANTPYKGMCIYIDYPDAPISVGAVQLDSLINGINYQEPTVERTFRKYWREQTRRNMDMQHDIFFYTAPLPSTYYATLSWQEGILLWRDALEFIILNNPTYNWNALSPNESGGLSIMVISSSFNPAGSGACHYPNWTLSNNVVVSRIYGSVLQAPWDNNLNMFMTLHESGHGIFFLPDTYDTQYNSGGTSVYTLMSGGQPKVEPVGAPFRVLNNWGYSVEPEEGVHTITLRADGDSVVVFRNPHDPFEFFSIEARKQSTLGNELFPADLGLLIWHSDHKVFTSNTLENMTSMQHYMHSIEQRDGLFELENNISGANEGDIYLPGNEFNTTSTPNTHWWDGLASGFELYDIQYLGANHIQFTINVPPVHEDHYSEISSSNWIAIAETPAQAGYDATKAFDDNLDTYYHIPWGNAEPRPHEVVLDLGDEYTINEFYYTANKNTSPPWEGRIEDFKIYISNNPNNWGPEVAEGTFFRTGIRQYVLFPETSGRYVKFSAMNSYDDDVRTSIAEIDLRGYLTPTVDVVETLQSAAFNVYPNPASDILTISIAENEYVGVEIYNANLQLIHSNFINQTSSINIQHLVNGLYIIKLQSSDKSEIFRFVKA